MATPIIDSVDQDELTYAKTPWWKLLLRRKMRLKSRTPMPQVLTKAFSSDRLEMVSIYECWLTYQSGWLNLSYRLAK